MSKTKLMAPSREIELIRQVQSNAIGTRAHKRALDELVVSNMGLVHKIVHRFPMKNATCSYDDLFQEGIAGLIHGIGKFDLSRGYRLSTYSYRWIQAFVSRYFQNNGRSIRVPVHMSTKQQAFNKDVELLTKQLGRTPTANEIRELNEDVDVIQSSMMNVSSLNGLINDNDELECLQGEDRTEEFDMQVDAELLLTKLRALVSDRDFSILTARFGLGGVPPHTLSELATKHNITRARIHQVESDCIKQLRQLIK